VVICVHSCCGNRHVKVASSGAEVASNSVVAVSSLGLFSTLSRVALHTAAAPRTCTMLLVPDSSWHSPQLTRMPSRQQPAKGVIQGMEALGTKGLRQNRVDRATSTMQHRPTTNWLPRLQPAGPGAPHATNLALLHQHP
jgi:hypothetical protein